MIGNSTEVGRALSSRCILPRRGKPLLAGNPRLQWEANLVASLSHRMLSLLAMGVFWYKFILSLRAPGLAQIKWNQLRTVLIDSPKVLDFWLNKPYPYSRYWTGTNLPWMHDYAIASAKTPCQYWECKYGLWVYCAWVAYKHVGSGAQLLVGSVRINTSTLDLHWSRYHCGTL